jgi:hypothetical protein
MKTIVSWDLLEAGYLGPILILALSQKGWK